MENNGEEEWEEVFVRKGSKRSAAAAVPVTTEGWEKDGPEIKAEARGLEREQITTSTQPSLPPIDHKEDNLEKAKRKIIMDDIQEGEIIAMREGEPQTLVSLPVQEQPQPQEKEHQADQGSMDEVKAVGETEVTAEESRQKEEEEMERKRREQEEAERQRLEEEAKLKKLEEEVEAERQRLLEGKARYEAEKQRLDERKRREEEAAKQQLEQEAQTHSEANTPTTVEAEKQVTEGEEAEIERQKEAERKRLEEVEAERKRLDEEEEKKRLEEEERVRKEEEARQRRERAAILIVSRWRGRRDRKAYLKRRAAVILIQTRWRGKAARKAFKPLWNSRHLSKLKPVESAPLSHNAQRGKGATIRTGGRRPPTRGHHKKVVSKELPPDPEPIPEPEYLSIVIEGDGQTASTAPISPRPSPRAPGATMLGAPLFDPSKVALRKTSNATSPREPPVSPRPEESEEEVTRSPGAIAMANLRAQLKKPPTQTTPVQTALEVSNPAVAAMRRHSANDLRSVLAPRQDTPIPPRKESREAPPALRVPPSGTKRVTFSIKKTSEPSKPPISEPLEKPKPAGAAVPVPGRDAKSSKPLPPPKPQLPKPDPSQTPHLQMQLQAQHQQLQQQPVLQQHPEVHQLQEQSEQHHQTPPAARESGEVPVIALTGGEDSKPALPAIPPGIQHQPPVARRLSHPQKSLPPPPPPISLPPIPAQRPLPGEGSSEENVPVDSTPESNALSGSGTVPSVDAQRPRIQSRGRAPTTPLPARPLPGPPSLPSVPSFLNSPPALSLPTLSTPPTIPSIAPNSPPTLSASPPPSGSGNLWVSPASAASTPGSLTPEPPRGRSKSLLPLLGRRSTVNPSSSGPQGADWNTKKKSVSDMLTTFFKKRKTKEELVEQGIFVEVEGDALTGLGAAPPPTALQTSDEEVSLDGRTGPSHTISGAKECFVCKESFNAKSSLFKRDSAKVCPRCRMPVCKKCMSKKKFALVGQKEKKSVCLLCLQEVEK